ncbi:GNAT family N-acetyltransferase [Marivirga sp. S37H4]|uniref:GNAT family N-acetyltransferase n=1 Tax=Marivirga aurantiaca TaxID=2802615 RepID=A0A934WVI6_9BACT|nr:GNAT family N-acetyltransferase [Marivirga aurantiaca]MBK6263823.1 GNAT family N-acetyltransferase [Marivirga aurantiaca]
MYSIFEEWPESEWEELMNFSLFTKKGFWELRKSEIKYVPLTVKNPAGKIISFWCFARLEGEWKTPYQAPYFEPFIIDENLLPVLIPQIISHLKSKYHQKISFILPPAFNQISKAIIHTITENNGFIEKVEISNYLAIKANRTFKENIQQKRKKRKLKSLLNSNYNIKEAEPNEWESLYQQLLDWRQLKGHRNLISKEWMLKAKTAFPDAYQCLQLRDGQNLIGLVFFMRTKSNSYYIYSLITNPDFDKDNPGLLLWNALYELAQKENVQYIDMGTSMINNKINRGLLHHKLALGSVMTKKHTLVC